MPHKYESPEIWHAILGQRNIVYENMKKRMAKLLDSIQHLPAKGKTINELLIPYTDIQWNVFRMIKQSRTFGIYDFDRIPMNEQLYMD